MNCWKPAALHMNSVSPWPAISRTRPCVPSARKQPPYRRAGCRRTRLESIESMKRSVPAIWPSLAGPTSAKSTLLNRLVGEKSASSRARRRRRVTVSPASWTNDDAQFVFVDTPGFQTKFSNALNRAMNRGVTQTLNDVDVVLFVIEAGRYDAGDKAVVRLLPKDRPVILVVNKTDQLKSREALLPFPPKCPPTMTMPQWSPSAPPRAVRPTICSARRASICPMTA